MTAIVYQASDALAHTVRNALSVGSWGQHVYIDEAVSNITSLANVWVVLRILSDTPGGVRGDRDERRLSLRVNCVSEDKDLAWASAAEMYALLHNSGSQDRTAVSIGVHSEWDFLTVTAGRFINLTPNKAIGTQFFEAGYEFSVTMEAKNGYS
jgi:hypothetical protein